MNAISHISSRAQSPEDASAREHLSPAQTRAFDELVELLAVAPLVALEGAPGLGKSTISRAFAKAYGGEVITWDEIVQKVSFRSTDGADDSILMAIEDALQRSDLVIIDATESLGLRVYSGRGNGAYFQLRAIKARLRELRKRLVVVGTEGALALFGRRPSEFLRARIDAFGADDYRTFLDNALGAERTRAIDFQMLYRTAPMLSGHDLRTLAGLLLDIERPTLSDAVDMLETIVLDCNTRIHEVEELSFADLPGTEDIAAKLETHVILPLTNKDLAAELGLKPKRGVLLYGPPGTGKTSIGRALAHRMKGRLHLIDGTFITEPPVAFFNKVRTIVQEAKDNAPSVLFVDDADVLFGIEHIAGFSRFLLSLLDGVESETASKVCVMMTAMNVSRVPSPIMRSGRMELWLETKAPDMETRAAIIRKWLGEDLPDHSEIDYQAVAAAADRFTPADLRRITADARTFHAADIIAGNSPGRGQDYLTRAVNELIATRAQMADNLRDESLRIGAIRPKAKYGLGIGGLVESSTSCATKEW